VLLLGVLVEVRPNGLYKVVVANNLFKINRTLDWDYSFGERFSMKIGTVEGGVLTKYWKGKVYGEAFFKYSELSDNNALLSNCYFKIGDLQLSTSQTDTSENWVYSATVDHQYE
jgi:hypothetical protein